MPKNLKNTKPKNVKVKKEKKDKKVDKVVVEEKPVQEDIPVVLEENNTPYLEEFTCVFHELDNSMSTIRNLNARDKPNYQPIPADKQKLINKAIAIQKTQS